MSSDRPPVDDSSSTSTTSDQSSYDWTQIPTEIWINVWNRLPTSSILACTQLSRDFRDIIRSRDSLSIDPPPKLDPKSESLTPDAQSFQALLSKFPRITTLRLCTMSLSIQHIHALAAPQIQEDSSFSVLTSSMGSTGELLLSTSAAPSQKPEASLNDHRPLLMPEAPAPILDPLRPLNAGEVVQLPNPTQPALLVPPTIPTFILETARVINANLTALILDNQIRTPITDKWALAIWFPNVTHLELSGCNLSSSALTPANFSPSLTHLNLSSCLKVQEKTLDILAFILKNLEILEIRGLYRVTDSNLVRIAQANPRLRVLDVSALQNIGNTALQGLAKYCPKMSSLLIKKTRFTAQSLLEIPIIWANTMHTLNLSLCPNVEEDTLFQVLAGLNSLRYLFLQGASLTPQSRILQVIGDNCPNLESLDLRDCTEWEMDEFQLGALLTRCLKLHALYLRSPYVKDSHIEIMSKYPAALNALYLQECTSLTAKSIAFFNSMPLLTRLVLTDIIFDPSIKEELAKCHHTLITWTEDPKAARRSLGRKTNAEP